MRRTVPLLVALALVAAVLLFVFLRGGSGVDPRGHQAGPAAAAEPGSAAPTPVELASASRVSDEPAAAPTAPAAAVAPGAAQVASAAPSSASARVAIGRRVEGRVVPLGGQLPEGVLVFAVTADSKLPADFVGRTLLAASASDLEQTAAGSVLAHVPADASGGFALDVAGTDGDLRIAAIAELGATADFVEWRAASPQALVLSLEPRAVVELVLERATTAPELDVGSRKVRIFPPEGNWQDFDRVRGTWDGARGVTDAGGRARFVALPVELELEARAQDDAIATGRVQIAALAPGERRSVTLEARAGARITGRVVTPEGSPVDEAEVSVHQPGPFGAPGRDLRETESDDEGAFALSAVGEGASIVVVRADGFLMLTQRLEHEPQEGETVDLGAVELDRGARLAGIVSLADGSVAAAATIEARVDPTSLGPAAGMRIWRGAETSGTADDTGRFELSGLAGGGKYDLSASFAAADGAKWIGSLRGVADGARDIVLELARAPQIAGTVVAPDGSPAAGAAVIARGAGSGAGAWGMPARGQTVRAVADDQGVFAMPLDQVGRFEVSASAEACAESEPVEIDVPSADVVVLRLRPALSVRGRVVDPSGAPLAGATVGPAESFLERMERLGSGRGAECVSDEEGRFELTGVPPGEAVLEARHADFAVSETVAVTLAVDTPTPEPTIAVRKGARIEGVLYERGEPAPPGKQIIANMMPAFETRFATTKADGRFELARLTPGSWQVMSMGGMDLTANGADGADGAGDDMASLFENLTIEIVELADGDVRELELGAPPAAPVRVRGRVLAAGEPLEQGIVSFMPVAGGMSDMRMATIGDGGRYEATLGSAGKYLVTAADSAMASPGTAGSQIELLHEIPEVEDHVLDLTLPGGTIRGRVTGPGRRPIEGTMVTWSREDGFALGSMTGGGMGTSRTDADGRYELRLLGAGRYRLTAGGVLFGGMMDEDPDTGRALRTGLALGEDELLDGVDFELEQPGSVHGRVRDSNGKPIANAALFARDGAGNVVDTFSFVQTSASGSFDWRGLAPGEYTFHARQDDLVSPESRAVRVRAGEVSDVELTLGEGAYLVVRVDDAAMPENGLGFVRLLVRDEHGRQVGGTFALEDFMDAMSGERSFDEQRFGPFPPGRYSASATDPTGRTTDRSVELSSGQERRLRLRFKD